MIIEPIFFSVSMNNVYDTIVLGMNFFVNRKTNKLFKAVLYKKVSEIFYQYLMNIPSTEVLFFETFLAAYLQVYVKRTPQLLFVLEL